MMMKLEDHPPGTVVTMTITDAEWDNYNAPKGWNLHSHTNAGIPDSLIEIKIMRVKDD